MSGKDLWAFITAVVAIVLVIGALVAAGITATVTTNHRLKQESTVCIQAGGVWISSQENCLLR